MEGDKIAEGVFRKCLRQIGVMVDYNVRGNSYPLHIFPGINNTNLFEQHLISITFQLVLTPFIVEFKGSSLHYESILSSFSDGVIFSLGYKGVKVFDEVSQDKKAIPARHFHLGNCVHPHRYAGHIHLPEYRSGKASFGGIFGETWGQPSPRDRCDDT